MRFAAQAAAAHAAAAAAAARGQPPTAATSSNVPPPPTNGQDRQAVERGGSEGFNGNGDAAASSDGNNPNQGLLNVGIPNILRAALTGSRDVRVLKIETVILSPCFPASTVYALILQIPQQYRALGRQGRDRLDEHNQSLIDELIRCDNFEDIATLQVKSRGYSNDSFPHHNKACSLKS